MDKGARPIRNRKNSRRSWTPVHQSDIHRPIKRLFTPEIKRMLKDWLVRRRENPYPSREEKKSLAQKTGLTYIQICNWFANWRRKLKNAGKEPQKNTWGNLIKNYNTNARGNVEQFSICSGDSIWEDEERRNDYLESKLGARNAENFSQAIFYNSYPRFDAKNSEFKDTDEQHFKDDKSMGKHNDSLNSKNDPSINYANEHEQCYQVSSTTHHIKSTDGNPQQPLNYFSNPKYKNQIMEKYLRGLDGSGGDKNSKCGLELSKWLESAAKFTPDKNNYIEWQQKGMRNKHDEYSDQYSSVEMNVNNHEKEELDAAEALTFLAGNCKTRWVK